jgi:polysaccharide deacetylase 2 family uncharacterized protein YibQ
MRFLSEKRTVIIAVVVFILVVGSIPISYFLFRSDFPDTMPSVDRSGLNDKNFQAQTALFNKFTKYIRLNHGSIVEAEEIDPDAATANDKKQGVLAFVHKYKFINDRLIINLIRSFSQTEGIEYKIKKYTYKDKKLNKPDTYEVVFFNKSLAWVTVKLEWQDESLFQKRKQIQYTESAEQSAIDQEESEPSIKPTDQAKLVIVIDDLGNNRGVLDDLLQLDFNITYAILPQLPQSWETAELVNQAGHDVMLHLPMQPKEWPRYNPGDGALFITDSEVAIYQKMAINLQSLPHVIGVNNHMGSAYTQYSEGLDVLMKILKEKNLFFMDSKTAPGNTAKQTAIKNNVRYLSRNIFLDNLQQEGYIKEQLYKAAAIARKNGRAIAIGHPYPVTYQVLARHLPLLQEDGIEIIPVSRLIAD